MFFILFSAAIGYCFYFLVKHGNQADKNSTVVKQSESAFQLNKMKVLSWREKYSSVKYNMPGKKHKIWQKTFMKSFHLIFCSILIITMGAIVGKSLFATILLTIICFIVFFPAFILINLELRRKYKQDYESDFIVEQELERINDFVIPADWSKKYL